MTTAPNRYAVDFPTLWVVPDWIERHCVIPDGFRKGRPFTMYDWQLWCTANHYRIREDATQNPAYLAGDLDALPVLTAAFVYRRSQIMAPQKALALDTPIATPAGWSTMGELAVGDEVFDETGLPVRVLSKSPVWEADTYRVTFSDDASLVACGDHEWWVEWRNKSTRYVEARVRTEDLVGNLTDRHGARLFRVPVAEPIQTPEADLLVPPYTLGAWLGDGHSDDGRITGIDDEVFDRIEADGFTINRGSIAKRRQVLALVGNLRRIGVLRNKHIPSQYLRGSIEQRWALLQGLMDTDGYADIRGTCEFTTTLPALRDGVRDLLWSLGLKNTCYEGLATLYGRVTGPKWRINFAARSDQPIFALKRKQARLKPPGRSHSQFLHRRIVSVERIPTVPTQCLTVDNESHIFLAGREMIPTCNTGKGPLSAALVCAEAVGPVLFLDWAKGGEVYRCSDFGCDCGWTYVYEAGEPMGHPWPTPLIQLLATSEDQVDNVYRPLQAMARGPMLSSLMRVGEQFIRLPNDGKIEVVTSSALSRLGNPLNFCLQDESQLYTAQNKLVRVAETMRRGAAAMGGRSIETTNCYDPSESSVAQRTRESKRKDIFKFYEPPPPKADGTPLSYTVKAERTRIHRYNYAGSPHVDLNGIEGEAAELAEKDPGQAERFYGNRIVAGLGSWLPGELWNQREVLEEVPAGTQIVVGFDGSDIDDWTGIRCETREGYQFTPSFPDGRPMIWNPAEHGGQVPRLEVDAGVDHLFSRFKVVRMYADPPYWETEIDTWAAKYGEKRVVRWATFRPTQMHAAAERLLTDVGKSDSGFSHDSCETTAAHIANARKTPRPNGRYVLAKPGDGRKIDMSISSILAHEAAGDVTAAKLWKSKSRGMVVM